MEPPNLSQILTPQSPIQSKWRMCRRCIVRLLEMSSELMEAAEKLELGLSR